MPVNGLKFAMPQTDKNAQQRIKAYSFDKSWHYGKNGIVSGVQVNACMESVFTGQWVDAVPVSGCQL